MVKKRIILSPEQYIYKNAEFCLCSIGILTREKLQAR